MKRAQVSLCLLAAFSWSCQGSASPTITEKLESEGKTDEEAYDDAACWCKGLKEALATRGRERDFREKHLERKKTADRLGNERIHGEIQEHHEQIRSLNASAMPTEEAVQSRDREFHAKALESVRKAKADLPKGTSDEVKATLDSLENTFSDKLEAAKAAETGEPGGEVGKRLRESKANMIRLEHEAVASKSAQLAAGEASREGAAEHLDAYAAQGEADDAFGTSVGNLCDALSAESTERTRLRQKALIGSSQVTHGKAHESWARSAAKLSLAASARQTAGGVSPISTAASTLTALRGLRDSESEGCNVAALEVAEGEERKAATALADARGASQELTDLLGRTNAIRGKLESALNSAVVSAHLFDVVSSAKFLQAASRPVPAMDLVHPSPIAPEPSAPVPVDLKEAVAALGRAASVDLEADAPRYAEVEASERQRRVADTELLRVLEAEHTAASRALAAAKC